jgi:sulfur carrier protein ThiS
MVTTVIPAADARVLITAQKHPLRDDVALCEVPYGQTIAEILGNPVKHVFVTLNGRVVPRRYWHHVRPKAGARLDVKLLAAGGGDDGNKFVRTMLTIVVAAVAIYTGQIYGLGTWQGAFAAASVAAIGSMAVNALVPPQLPEPPALNSGQSSFNRKYSLTGTRNQMLPYGVVPNTYGKHRLYPPFGAKPYTEIAGEDQFLRVLLVLGYGPLDVSSIRIGDTPIEEYDDVEYEISESPNLFSNDVEEEALSLVYDGNGDLGTAHVRTTTEDADEIFVDFAFPRGLFCINDIGNNVSAYINLRVEYRASGSSDPWLNAVEAPGVQYIAGAINGDGWMVRSAALPDLVRITGRVREVRRCSLRWRVNRGQYDVRVTKVSHEHAGEVSEDEQKYREMVWTTLRTVSHKLPVNMPSGAGILLFAARIRATDQLQGVTDRINMIVERHLPVWNGSAWVVQKTRDPAWACVDALCGPAAKRPLNRDTQIVKADFRAWALDNAAKGRYFDAVIDAATTVRAVLRDAAACGRAVPTLKNGQHSIVRDVLPATPVQLFTPRNSWGFSGSKHFYEPLHGVRVHWVNPDLDWQQDDTLVVYADGYNAANATEIGEVQARGCTNYIQAYRMGLYQLIVSEQRRETFSLYADFENLRCSKGSLVRVAHDVINVGLRAARVKSVTVDVNDDATGVVLDETVEMLAGRSYALVVRRNDGTQQVQTVQTVAGETNALTFTAPVPGVHVGDLVTFGYSGQETIDLIVRDIRRGPEHSAQLFLLPAAPAIEDIDTTEPPTYVPPSGSIVIDPAIAQCCEPVLEQPGTGTSVRSGNTVAGRATGGIKLPHINLRIAHQEP